MTPEAVNEHIGKTIRELRTAAKMSQTTLGSYFNVSFQQVQKYEKGTNIVSPDKLFILSQLFKIPVQCFFPEEVWVQ